MAKKRPKIVTIGGGTGQFTVLSGLVKTSAKLIAIVNMVDDGGSTGVLRDELGVLPPGDVRQCLVALSRSSETMRSLFNYRFEKGEFKGHNVGNLLITALEKITGNFNDAVKETSEILAISGRVIPVTTKDTNLCLEMKKGKIVIGQHKIDNSFFEKHRKFLRLFLKPKASLDPDAKIAIKEADIIVIGPGSFYTSIVPNLLVEGMSEALRKSKAVKIYITNLVNKKGQTDNFTVSDYVREIEKLTYKGIFDYVIYNSKKPSNSVLKKYKEEGGNLVIFDKKEDLGYKTIGTDLISKKIPKRLAHDKLERTLIRHNEDKLAKMIIGIYEETRVGKNPREYRAKKN